MKAGKYLISVLMLAAICSCGGKGAADLSRTPLLEVEGRFLYLDEVQAAVSPNLAAGDSTATANAYIRQWVTDALLYANAKRNISDRREIDEMLAVYEKSLIIQQYKQKLIDQRLPKAPSEEELHDFYLQHKDRLLSAENFISGILLVLPRNAADIDRVRGWVRAGDNAKALENIEKYSLQNAISYEYFGNEWKPLSEIFGKTAFHSDNPAAFVQQSDFYETQDSTRHYMLKITACCKAGEPQPFEIARRQITNMIMNKKRNDFINRINNELYDDAVRNDLITYF